VDIQPRHRRHLAILGPLAILANLAPLAILANLGHLTLLALALDWEAWGNLQWEVPLAWQELLLPPRPRNCSITIARTEGPPERLEEEEEEEAVVLALSLAVSRRALV
jgi:hypothetical protein